MKRLSILLFLGLLLASGCVRVTNLSSLSQPTPAATQRAIPYTLVAPTEPPPTPTDIPPTATITLTPTIPPTPTITPTLPPPPTPLPGAVGPYAYDPMVNPITGLPVDDIAQLNRRPIVAKISNAPPLVRPQAGLDYADIVFEHYAEGGLTRFSAVFYTHLPQRVGSIRSARLIDNEVVPMYQGLLVYSGASNGVNAVIAASEFFERTYMGILYGLPYYWRDEDIPIPHNMFANLDAVSRLATAEGLNDRPDLTGMAFLDVPPPNPAGQAHVIEVEYVATRARWEYDPAANTYRRFSDGQPHYDALTDQQITADNVVVLFAEHPRSEIAEAESSAGVSYGLQIKLWFEGDAILFRDGQRYEGRWLRPTRESMIQLRTRDGELLYFRPGNTFFQVVRTPAEQDPAEEALRWE